MQDDALNTGQPSAHGPDEEHHPTVKTYIKVAIILAIITLVEVGVFYLDFSRIVFILIFVGMSGLKFAIVIMWYMHLKFDDILFSRLFIGGLAIAAAAFFALLALFSVF